MGHGAENRAVELYQGNPIEIVKPAEIQEIEHEEQFMLGSDIIVGNYGVIGFQVLDTRPESRYQRYNDRDLGAHCSDEDSYLWENDTFRRNHYIGTEHGFKIVRVFALPPEVTAFFDQDRFLGDPMIEKCLRGDVPDEFDEEPAYPGWAFGFHHPAVVDAAILFANPSLANSRMPKQVSLDVKMRMYISFHRYWDFRNAVGFGEESVRRAISTIDEVIAKFDNSKIMETRGLELAAEIVDLPGLVAGQD